MIIKPQFLVRTKCLTKEQTCVVNLKVSQQACIVTNLREIDEGESQVKYDTLEDHTYSIPAEFSFSFNELDNFPSRCKERLHQQLLTHIDPDERLYLVDKLVEYMTNFCKVEGDSDCGYVFDATLEILCFSMMGVCTGTYVPENREEVVTCSVCLENVMAGVEYSVLPCYHIFHSTCIDSWLETNITCPNCRYSLEDGNDVEDRLTDLMRLNNPIRRNPSA